MIKIEHCVYPLPEQMKFVVEGMRNPMDSWDRSDSEIREGCISNGELIVERFMVGKNDNVLMVHLAEAGPEHRKYMRMMPVYARITAPLYFWKEFDTYKIGTTSNSCSTMLSLLRKEFTLDDFSHEHLIDTTLLESVINELNVYRNIYTAYDKQTDEYKKEFSKKDIWWQIIQLLPSSYNQTRNISMNYEVLCNIYKQRNNHKLDEWHVFCRWIKTVPYSDLIAWDVKAKEEK